MSNGSQAAVAAVVRIIDGDPAGGNTGEKVGIGFIGIGGGDVIGVANRFQLTALQVIVVLGLVSMLILFFGDIGACFNVAGSTCQSAAGADFHSAAGIYNF